MRRMKLLRKAIGGDIKTEYGTYTELPPVVEDRGNARGRTTCRANLDMIELSFQLITYMSEGFR